MLSNTLVCLMVEVIISSVHHLYHLSYFIRNNALFGCQNRRRTSHFKIIILGTMLLTLGLISMSSHNFYRSLPPPDSQFPNHQFHKQFKSWSSLRWRYCCLHRWVQAMTCPERHYLLETTYPERQMVNLHHYQWSR